MRLATLTLALMLSVTAQAGPDNVHAEPATAGERDPEGPHAPAPDAAATDPVPTVWQQGNETDGPGNGTSDDNRTDDGPTDEELDEGDALTSLTTRVGLGALAVLVLVFFFVRTTRK